MRKNLSRLNPLSEKDINLHIFNNNFFETKKLLEKDDTESHYLIYSPEAERDAQSNWLLDIQLYFHTLHILWREYL
jgi:hypothetical protein